MKSIFSIGGRMFRSGHWWLAVVMLIGVSGCNTWELRDEQGYGRDEIGSTARELRSSERDVSTWGYNEKARQIERNLSRQ